MANRKFIVLSDQDEAACRHAEQFRKERRSNDWYKYKDVLSTCEVITGEDFIKSDYILLRLKEIVLKYPKLSTPDSLNLNVTFGKMAVITNWIKQYYLIKEERSEIIEATKSQIFDNLKRENIEDVYFDYLNKVIELLQE